MSWDPQEVYRRKRNEQHRESYLRNLPPERQEELMRKRALREAPEEERLAYRREKQREYSRKTRQTNKQNVRRSRVRCEMRRAYAEDRSWFISVLRELVEHGNDLGAAGRAAEDPCARVGDTGAVSPPAEK